MRASVRFAGRRLLSVYGVSGGSAIVPPRLTVDYIVHGNQCGPADTKWTLASFVAAFGPTGC